MRYLVECRVHTSLHVRYGPSVSYGIHHYIYPGTQLTVNDIKRYGDGEIWYKIEGTSYWACGYRPSVHSYYYLAVIKDLEGSSAKPATPSKEPATTTTKKESIDIGTLGYNNKGKLAPWDVKYKYAFGDSVGVNSGYNVPYRKGYNGEINLNNVNQSLEMDTSFLNSNEYYKKTKMNIGANYYNNYSELNYDYFHKINRYRLSFPDYYLPKAFPFIFFTRPELYLIEEDGKTLRDVCKTDPVFSMYYKNNPDIIRSLTSYFSSQHGFNLFLGNTATSFEVGDEVIKTHETDENFVGYKVSYGKNNHASMGAGNFTINYTDDRNLTILKMHKVWLDYISQVSKGAISPLRYNILHKVIDYACSAFYILVAADGETIIYGHKYIGVYPTNVPDSALSWSKGSSITSPDINISYEYWFREPLSAITMAEFNLLSKDMDKSEYVKTYNPNIGNSPPTWVGIPFIEEVKNKDGTYEYKLRFRPI